MNEKAEKSSSFAIQLLESCRNELMGLYPHLDLAFAQLVQDSVPGGGSIGLDGQRLYFSPRWVLEQYSSNPAQLRRGLLHILLHGLFLHPFTRPGRDDIWDLACDMAVEQMIHRENQPRLTLQENPIRERCLTLLGDELLPAEVIEQMLLQDAFPYSPSEMLAAFSFDDHDPWGMAYTQKAWKNRWEELGAGAEKKKRHAGRVGTVAGDFWEEPDVLKPRDLDYRSWLRQFTVIREELELDTESFDPIFYHYGLEHYGNMPLVEALEYKEVARLEELVIAIDTSGSCSREMVQRFLEDTYAILSSRENFFRKMNVYLLQCDCMIQDVQLIRSADDWQRCCRHITIQGRGGTDFTPVFHYVDKLRREKKVKNLKALLYFTDGEGFYPREKPEYETAFVFSRESESIQHAPAWAKKLMLGGRRVVK